MAESADVEQVVRTRLRSLRTTLGLSLDELAARTNLSPSTISRVETGKRAISLDVLLPLAAGAAGRPGRAAGDEHRRRRGDPPDPEPAGRPHHLDAQPPRWQHRRGQDCAWSRPAPRCEQRVHPGHDWLFVLTGRIRLSLGEREIVVAAGEAAEFATMTPHAVRRHRPAGGAGDDLRPGRPAGPHPPRRRLTVPGGDEFPS